jgi:hypothetical protein
MMKTRNGKIARLPKNVREQLMDQSHIPGIPQWVRADSPNRAGIETGRGLQLSE